VAGGGSECEDSSLSELAETHETARGEGNVPREPELNVKYRELPASAIGKGHQLADVVVVPVWFHVVHDNGIGDVSAAEVDRQIRIMNLGFSGFYGGYDQGFRFELVGVTRTDNADWFYASDDTG
jgi:hypothetical protein